MTIITVVFNGALHLEQTIQAVLGQSYANIEYIVVDGGSTDGTLGVLAKYNDRIDYWISEPDHGIYDAMNKAISAARGDTIGLLNCGDTYEPWFVEKLVRGASAKGDISRSVAYCNFKTALDDIGLVQYYTCDMRYWRGMSVCHQTMLIGKEIYRELGPYDMAYRLASDYEYLLRMATRGVCFVAVDGYGVTFRDGGHSSSNMDASHREARQINRRYFGTWSLRHLAFTARSWYQLVSYFYLKKLLYRLLGTQITNRIRLTKKSILGTARTPPSPR